MKSIHSFILTIALLISFVKESNAQTISFSLQGSTLTWFDVTKPETQGVISITDLPPGTFSGNSLAYDDANQRLLFLNGPAALSHDIYSINVNSLTLTPGATSEASASPVGGIVFNGTGQALYGAGFYGGYYYTLINGTDTLIRIGFDENGMVNSRKNINLGGTNEMYLGDIAFNSNGDMWISGYNQTGANKLWRFHTNDNETFTSLGAALPSPTDRYNGIFFADNVLYGYHLATSEYGIISTTDGSLDTKFIGAPFNVGGDLTNGVVIPEPSGFVLSSISFLVILFIRRR